MNQQIGQVAIIVDDYEEAIAFYTQKLSFELLEDTPLTDSKRWVVVAPKGGLGCRLLLAKASTKEQISRIGNQTGGRVFLFLYTDDLLRDYNAMQEAGINFVREPTEEPYGIVSVFKDLYGNLWDFIQTNK